MSEETRVLIVGGGIGGLALGAALDQPNIELELIERNPDWHALGAGLLVQANGMRALRGIGLDAAVEDAGTRVVRWLYSDLCGEVLSEIDLAAFWGDVGPCIGIARAGLQQVLVRATSALPCRLGTSVTALSLEDGHVTVVFTDGSKQRYDLVVGADGIHSMVRRLAFRRGALPTFAGQLAWRCIAPLRRADPPGVEFFLGDGCFFGLCSIGNGYTYGFGNAPSERLHDPVEGRLGRLRQRFAHFGEAVQAFLERLECDEQVYCSPIEWVDQKSWVAGRVVLIGDAAHATSPMMGQGGCLAVEDAWVLAQCLSRAPTVEGALADYVARRKPPVRWVQQQSQTLADSIRLPPSARDSALRQRGEELFRERFAPLRREP